MNNPLDLKGPEFLILYVSLMVGLAVVAFLLRYALRIGYARMPVDVRSLGAGEIAYLGGGEKRAIE